MAKSVKKTAARTKAAAKPRKPAQKKTVTAVRAQKSTVSHQQVAELAHRFFNERGRVHGQHQEDWFRAERELLAKAS